ncbi:MAG: hypothetical protein IMF12_05010, partial [Proteobacteria bacterium]|nr:hypothetical protein [Pseudomonadota bacterium]
MNILKYILTTVLLLVTHTIFAATITVTNNGNSNAGSLRQAIFDATAGDTINFAADYIITLNNELVIDKDLTIDGGKNNIAISGNNSVRIFNIFMGTVNLNYLTIKKGKVFDDGGGIVNGGNLTIKNSTILNNSAMMNGGGIYSMGMLQIIDSTFANNSASNFGGGLYDMSSSAAISNSTFSGNIASSAGGIYAMTSFPLMNTIIANSTGSDCFGISSGDNFNTLIEDGSCDPTISDDPKL